MALIQGITEFLPVSSSAHLILIPKLVDGWADQGPLIDVASHVGTLIAVVIYFRSETAVLFRGGLDALQFRETNARRLFFMISAGTVPIVVAGGVLILFGWVEALRSPTVIGWAFIIFGILLWHSDREVEHKGDVGELAWKDAIVIGVAQAIALIPGTSRSGVTITASRYLGWSRTQAARYSMLLSIPTITIGGFFALLELLQNGTAQHVEAAAIVTILSFAFAMVSIAVLMWFARTASFTPFVIYRLVVGVLILVYVNNG